MKTIGLIGGMSWESTIPYYRIINEEVRKRLGGLHSAKIILHSVEFDEIEQCQSNGDWDKSAQILGKAAQGLEAAGVDFILICTNTMHKVQPVISQMIHIPIIHIADGTDMYVVSARGIRNADNKPGISYISYTRLKEWKYTDKGWFCYELCVPEPPEVSEIVDGSCLIRVKPMTEEQREMSERCVGGLGYQGQNLLCSNWNAENMSELDYNGMFEYLYGMKYGEKFNSEDYPNGIPKEEFESLIMEYLPVTKEQIREYAVFDEENQTYYWMRLGFSHAPSFFGTSLPEVVDIKENEDGTVTLTVEAVCDMVICDDAVITHELTVRFAEDGSFQYLGNEILNDGIMHIPDYQYRIKE